MVGHNDKLVELDPEKMSGQIRPATGRDLLGVGRTEDVTTLGTANRYEVRTRLAIGKVLKAGGLPSRKLVHNAKGGRGKPRPYLRSSTLTLVVVRVPVIVVVVMRVIVVMVVSVGHLLADQAGPPLAGGGEHQRLHHDRDGVDIL